MFNTATHTSVKLWSTAAKCIVLKE